MWVRGSSGVGGGKGKREDESGRRLFTTRPSRPTSLTNNPSFHSTVAVHVVQSPRSMLNNKQTRWGETTRLYSREARCPQRRRRVPDKRASMHPDLGSRCLNPSTSASRCVPLSGRIRFQHVHVLVLSLFMAQLTAKRAPKNWGRKKRKMLKRLLGKSCRRVPVQLPSRRSPRFKMTSPKIARSYANRKPESSASAYDRQHVQLVAYADSGSGYPTRHSTLPLHAHDMTSFCVLTGHLM